MKNTFLTVCSTDKYLNGVLVLNESIKQVESKYKLNVLITNNVTTRTEQILNKNGIKTIRIDKKINIPNHIEKYNEENGFSNWNYTLDKLYIFELEQFDKIVYLDSDMLVIQNIDELFEKEHMSAVVAGKSYPGNTEWKQLNSGTMVIIPQKGLLQKFIEIIPYVAENKKCLGDQDILQMYYSDWPQNSDLNLDEKYNIFYGYLDYYIKNLGYKVYGKQNEKNIAIIHFVGIKKPWMKNKNEIIKEYLKLIRYKKFSSLKVIIKYRKILKKVTRNNDQYNFK